MERLLLWQTSSLPSLSPISILSGKLSSFCSLSLGGSGGGERGDHRTVDSFFPAICRGLGRERLPLLGQGPRGILMYRVTWLASTLFPTMKAEELL